MKAMLCWSMCAIVVGWQAWLSVSSVGSGAQQERDIRERDYNAIMQD